MSKLLIYLTLFLLASCSCQQALAQEAEKQESSLSVLVNQAIDRGVEFLLTKQNTDGSFQGHYHKKYPMGNSALILLALVKSNLNPRHPAVVKGLEYLQGLPFKKTYSVSTLLMLLYALQSPQNARWMKSAADWLAENVNVYSKIWAYPDGSSDLRNTQYAVLGLRAASLSGYKAPKKIWSHLLFALEDYQNKSGGYPYHKGRLSTGSMTVAGIAISIICLEELKGASISRKKREEFESNLNRAFDWLELRYAISRNPEGDWDGWADSHLYYYLYGLERVGSLSGQQTIAGRDWYQEGAEFLVKEQKKEGKWNAKNWVTTIPDTCFALLFLRRASITLSPKDFQVARKDKAKAGKAPPKPSDHKNTKPQVKVGADIPFITSWLLLGPFDNRDDKGLNTAFIDEKVCAPRNGLKQARERWSLYSSDEDKIDLHKGVLNKDYVIAYAFTYLHAARECDGLLWFGGDDGAKIFLNGEEIFYRHDHGALSKDKAAIPITLRKGVNRLLVKMEDVIHGWWFSARISDKEGKGLSTLQASTRRSRK